MHGEDAAFMGFVVLAFWTLMSYAREMEEMPQERCENDVNLVGLATFVFLWPIGLVLCAGKNYIADIRNKRGKK